MQLLGHLQADEAGTDDHGAHAGFRRGCDPVHVLQIAQGENARIVDAGNGRTQGRGARCEHQPVIRLPFAGTAIDVADFHAFVGAVDAYGFAVGAHVEIEHGLQRCRGLDGERVACRDLSADEIG